MGVKDLYFRHVVEHTGWHVFAYWFTAVFLSVLVNLVFPVLYPGGAQLDKLADPSSEAQRLFDARNLARQLYTSENVAFTTAFVLQFETANRLDVFTPRNLQIICEVERLVMEESDLDLACEVDSPALGQSVCVSQRSNLLPLGTSISSVFYAFNASNSGTFWENSVGGFPLPSVNNLPIGVTGFFSTECDLLPQANVDYVKSHLVGNNLTLARQLYGFFLADRSIANGFSDATRSVLQLGSGSKDSLERVLYKVEGKLISYFGLKSEFFRSVYRNEAKKENLKVIFVEESLAAASFQDLIPPDIILLISSVTFVFAWMWINTGAFGVALPCVIGVLSTVSVAEAIYKLVLRIEYFDFVHALAILFILGIGADAVFVVFDAWKQSQLVFEDDFKRYKYTVERSTKNVFSSAFTTAASFIATAITPIVVLSTFGIFCALTILVCLVYTFTVFPSTILLWDRYTQRKEQGEDEKTDEKDLKIAVSDAKKTLAGSTSRVANLGYLENSRNRWMKKLYFPFIQNCHKPLVLIGLLVGGLGAFGLSKITPLSKDESFFPPDHMVQVFTDTKNGKWVSGAETDNIKVEIFWGINDVQRNFWGWYTGEPSRYGDVLLLDEAFDLSDFAAQSAILSHCQNLSTAPCGLPECQNGMLMLATLPPICPIGDFHAWWLATFNNTDFALQNKTAQQKSEFFARLRNFSIASKLEDYIGFRQSDGKLIFFGTEWRLSVVSFESGETKRNVESLLNQVTDSYNSNAPLTAQARFASSEFARSALEAALVDSVGRGLLIAFGLVSIVLLFGTNNYYLAFFSVTAISLIVVTVLGIVFGLLEWQLGLAESAITILSVGFSVDYSVHLCQMYGFAGTDEGLKSPEDKFKYAALTMGPTVIAGGVTLLGAACFLIFGQITFFLKMAIFMFLVISLSLYFAFFFLMPLLYWIGPENTRGTIIKRKQAASDL